MAEIDVVPKRKSNAWVWILAVLVALVILWYFFIRPADGSRVGGGAEPASVTTLQAAVIATDVVMA